MVDWGVVYGWVNTGLLGLLGICVLVSGRWKHLRWLPVYALVTTALSVFQLGWLYVPEFSLVKRLICELLFLGAIVEVVYKDAKKRPFWPWFALLSFVIVPFLPIDPVLKYYLPQEIFAVGVALELHTAVQKKIAPLLGWSVLGAATVVSDILKFTSPSGVMPVLRFVDPLVYMGSILIILGGLFWKEIEQWILPFFRALNRSMWKTVTVEERIPAGNAQRAAVDSSVGYKQPLPLRVVKPEEIASDKESEEIINRIEALEDKLLVIEEIMRDLVGFSSRPRMRRALLSPVDMAVYLGITEETARQFVKEHNIPKVPIGDKKDDWRVFRSDIDAALDDDDLR
jgi:hypothetical protein